jgi:hypothetical protein
MGELLPFDESDFFVFLVLKAGTGAAARAPLDLYPQSSAILADLTPQIIDERRRSMEPYNGRFQYVKFDMLAEHWSSTIPASLDGFVTSQCIHITFQTSANKAGPPRYSTISHSLVEATQ